MNARHYTPGPWNRGYGQNIYRGERPDPSGNQRLIASCEPTTRTQEDWEETWANAALIATAPDLLELLEEVSAARAKQDKEFDVDAWYVRVRATIAKAKGEK